MAANQALDALRTASGGGPATDAAFAMLGKLLGNIVAHPEDLKFRRLKPDNQKLHDTLFRYPSSKEFLVAVGFTILGDGSYEFPQGSPDILRDASALVAQYGGGAVAAAAADPLLASYRAALDGGAHGAGVAEAEAVAAQPGGIEALQLLEKILVNVRRFPDERYRCINLDKPATRKVLPAAPLLHLAGFQEGKLPTGEDCMTLVRVNADVLERVWAICLWSCVPMPLLEPTVPGSTLDHAMGALLGAAIGDALGAPLGTRGPFEVTAQELDKAMEMCGGGRWSVAPGQPTGNTELLVCFAEALAEAGASATSSPPLEDLAARYGKWGQSQPFRAEKACRQAFQKPLPSQTMRERAKDQNQKSMGAGALNRCLPAAVLCAAQGLPNSAAVLARADCSLSHPDVTVSTAVATYAAAAAQLIAAAGDRRVALDELQALLAREIASSRAASQLGGGQRPAKAQRGEPASAGGNGADEWAPPGTQVVALEVITGWLREALAEHKDLPFSDDTKQSLRDHEVGSVQIPFAHAFRHLHRGTDFEAAMRAVLAGGGDACATAGAVGGLLGAALGARGLPPRWVKAVLCCDTNLGQFRPPDYAAKNLPQLAARMCAVRASR